MEQNEDVFYIESELKGFVVEPATVKKTGHELKGSFFLVHGVIVITSYFNRVGLMDNYS